MALECSEWMTVKGKSKKPSFGPGVLNRQQCDDLQDKLNIIGLAQVLKSETSINLQRMGYTFIKVTLRKDVPLDLDTKVWTIIPIHNTYDDVIWFQKK